MTTYSPEEQQFLDFWIPQIINQMTETGILSLELLANLTNHPDKVRFLERYLELQETGDVNQLSDNYRKRYYTRQCLAYHTPNECMVFAAERGDILMVEMLAYPPYNASDFHQAMIYAALGGHRELVVMLANPPYNATSFNLALTWATRKGHREIVEMLLPRATINGINRAMVQAALKGNREIVEMLLPYTTTKWINRAIAEATYEGNREMVEMLFPYADNDGINRAMLAT